MKKFIVYVLRSRTDGSLYKGMTADLNARINQHNSGKTKSTKSKMPWEVIYTEEFSTVKEARSREKYLKTAAGRRFLKEKLG